VNKNNHTTEQIWRLAALLISFLVIVFPIALSAKETLANEKDPLLGTLQFKLNELYASIPIPGVTASVVLPNGKAIEVAAGFANAERTVPLQPGDHMLSGSIGKTYVSAVLLELVSENRARLDDKLQTFLGSKPWYLRLPNARDITLRSLLNHTSGVPNHVNQKAFIEELRASPGRAWTPDEIVGYVLDQPPIGPVGQKYLYADTNYILIGMVIEKITGNTYYQELERRILHRFQLSDTHPSAKVIPELVDGYTQSGNPFGLPAKVSEAGRDALNPEVEWAGGGLVSNSRDIARWAYLLYGGHVVDPKSLRQILADTTAASEAVLGPGTRYGLGVYEWHTELGLAFGHQGDFPGYRSVMEYFPEHRVAVGMQFNTDDSTVLGAKPREFAAELVKIAIR
jgi:D-alanyl-D-alanine carboxypeptidase